MLREEDITSKIQSLTKSYSLITKRNDHASLGLSIEEFLALRGQAIAELQSGIIEVNNSISGSTITEQAQIKESPHVLPPKRESTSFESSKDAIVSTILEHETASREIESKKVAAAPIIFNSETEEEDFEEDSVAAKFARLKDL